MLKDDIIRELEENRGVPVSGQYLADKYNVSRNAVWKTINNLKKAGYQVVSATNSGYFLAEETDVISAQGIKTFLSDENKNIRIEVHEKIDSTNNEAKRLIISETVDKMLIVANEQTGGRGRLGRKFYSPADSGIYMSLIYHVPGGVKNPMLITMAAAVAVSRTIEKLTDVHTGIKWVNDIFVGERKVCGILTEAVSDLETGRLENVVVGIGINVKAENFPEELRNIADTLNVEKVTRNQIIAGVLTELLKLYDSFDSNDFMPEYIEHNIVVGRRVRYERPNPAGDTDSDNKDNIVIGTVEEVCKDGSLRVKSDDGIESCIFTGEIIFER